MQISNWRLFNTDANKSYVPSSVSQLASLQKSMKKDKILLRGI